MRLDPALAELALVPSFPAGGGGSVAENRASVPICVVNVINRLTPGGSEVDTVSTPLKSRSKFRGIEGVLLRADFASGIRVVMTLTLRDFIAQREGEIRDLLKALKTELRELQVAKGALDAPGNATSTTASSGPTIKEMALDVLRDGAEGMNSGEIQAAIITKFGREVDRTSLSPQLSRLKADDEVVLKGERWFAKPLFEAHQQRLAAMFDVDSNEEECGIEIVRAHDL